MEEDTQKWHHLFPDVPPSTGTALPGKAVRWPRGPFHACLRSHPVRGQPAGGSGVYLPSCLPTQTLQSQPWALSVFLAVSKCVARTKRQPQLMLSAHFSRLLLPLSPFRSPAVLQSITHAGALTCSPHSPPEPRATKSGYSSPRCLNPQARPSWSRDDRGQPVVSPAPHSLLVTQFSA